MSRHHIGVPLLSGPPPPPPSPQAACRKCGREFNLLFHRQRKCMHCGYGYCSSCTDYQALMPRRGPMSGHDIVHVCAYCIDMLNVTALGRAQLRTIPLSKLKRYVTAYNIPVKNPVDKNDFVDAALNARTSQGCLSHDYEDYYRKHSVPPPSISGSSPNRNSNARESRNVDANSNSRSNRPFPRPDLNPNRRQRQQETQNTHRSRTTSAPINPGTIPVSGQSHIPRPTSSAGQHSTSHSTDTTHVSSALPPPPMSTLVTLPRSYLSSLSVGTLKQILWEFRVRIPPAVVEKEELVERVWALVEEERRKDNEGIGDSFEMDEDDSEDAIPDTEEEAVREMVNPEQDGAQEHGQWSAHDTASQEIRHGHSLEGEPEISHEEPHAELPQSRSSTPQLSASPLSHVPQKPKPRSHARTKSAERSGLCVICQDEEANIAIIDCGHLSMCRPCSELVLASSKECPLCRTRIVTEARLLRIFKT